MAEVEVNKSTGQIAVKKITVAHDCGIVVNPDGVKNQIEGNVVQTVGRALMEQVDFDSAGVKSLDWTSYPIVRFNQVPDVEIVLLNHTELEPMGAGEAASIAVTAAIANAVFDATGARLHQVPFTPDRVLASLKDLKSTALKT